MLTPRWPVLWPGQKSCHLDIFRDSWNHCFGSSIVVSGKMIVFICLALDIIACFICDVLDSKIFSD